MIEGDVEEMIEEIKREREESKIIERMNEIIMRYEREESEFNRKNIKRRRYDVNEEGMTSIIFGLYNNMDKEVMELIEDEYIDKNKVDNSGIYALILACAMGKEEIAITLLS